MRECPKCMSWWDGDTCPVCEVSLMREYSSEDADDGVFADPYTDADILDDLAYECYTLRQDNVAFLEDNHALMEQINGSKS